MKRTMDTAVTHGAEAGSRPAAGRKPAPLVDRGRDDDAHTDGHGPYQDGQSDILVVDNFLPEMIRRHFVDQHEGQAEDQDAEAGIDDGIQQIAGVEFVHSYLPPIYLEYPPYVER